MIDVDSEVRPTLIVPVHWIAMRNHLIDLRFKDGVHEPTEAVETLSHAENGYLAPVVLWLKACVCRLPLRILRGVPLGPNERAL
jgi:hypothetical protein